MFYSTTIFFVLLFLTGCFFKSSENRPVQNEKKFLKAGNHHSKISKSRAYLEIDIVAETSDKDRLLLTGTIHPMAEFSSAEIQWKWPEHLKVISEDSPSPTALKPGEDYKVQLELSTKNLQEGDKIFLFVFQMKDGERHGASKMYVFQSDQEAELIQKKAQKKSSLKIME